VLRWLTRLFGQRDEAETAPAAPPPLETPQSAAAEPTPSDAVAVVEPVEAEPVEAEPIEAEPIEAPTLVELPETRAEADAKETCPTCGKIGVFAGPPGQRFCTYCALRDELFERSAAATE
jgi:hypothetical protein